MTLLPMDRLAQFELLAGLRRNWDGHGAMAPTPEALASARWLVGTVRPGELTDSFACTDGGIVIELGGTTEWWFDPEGSLQVIHATARP